MSSSDDADAREFLTLSNLAFLPPVLYLLIRVRPIPIIEPILITALGFASTFHHWCDPDGYGDNYCLFGISTNVLYACDFILACQMVPVIVAYSLDALSRSDIKLMVHLITMITSTIVFFFVNGSFIATLLSLIAVSSVFIIVYLVYKACFETNKYKNLNHFWHYHINFICFGLSVLFSGFGILYRSAADELITLPDWIPDINSDYYYAHSWWHIFMGLALFFSLRTTDAAPFYYFKPMRGGSNVNEENLNNHPAFIGQEILNTINAIEIDVSHIENN
jgi:hypothetical protein